MRTTAALILATGFVMAGCSSGDKFDLVGDACTGALNKDRAKYEKVQSGFDDKSLAENLRDNALNKKSSEVTAGHWEIASEGRVWNNENMVARFVGGCEIDVKDGKVAKIDSFADVTTDFIEERK